MEPFDLAILELSIPGEAGGRDVIEELQQLDPNVKAIVCGGYSSDPVTDNYENYGFKGRISKPFNARELGRVLLEVLEQD